MRFIITDIGDSKIYTDENKEYEYATEKNSNGNRTVTINDINIDRLSNESIYDLLHLIYYIAARDGVKLKIESAKPLLTSEIQQEDILVKNIEPIRFDGEIDIDDEMALYMCIESPVRNACMSLNEMGITTLMSSANKIDVESRNQKIDYYQSTEHFNIGNGYAWIMIDWETLSQDNKQKLIMLNNGTIPIELSDKEKANLVHNCEINKCTVSQKELVSFLQIISARLFSRGDRSLLKLEANFDEEKYYEQNRRCYVCNNSLCNHGDNYRTVVIRYPLDESTTISQVDNYFKNVIKYLSIQKKQSHSSDSEKRGI